MSLDGETRRMKENERTAKLVVTEAVMLPMAEASPAMLTPAQLRDALVKLEELIAAELDKKDGGSWAVVALVRQDRNARRAWDALVGDEDAALIAKVGAKADAAERALDEALAALEK